MANEASIGIVQSELRREIPNLFRKRSSPSHLAYRVKDFQVPGFPMVLEKGRLKFEPENVTSFG